MARPSPVFALGDVWIAFQLLTRIPVPRNPLITDRTAASAWAYPIVGAAVGCVAGYAALLALQWDLPPTFAAGLGLVVQIFLTGAMHEDGLADSADGLWGGWTRARRLEIMRDSRIGTYGVLALVLSLILRWAALTAICAGGPVLGSFVAVAALSRAPLPAIMWLVDPARQDGLSKSTGRPKRATAVASLLIGGAIALLVAGPPAAPAACLVLSVVAAFMGLAYVKLGGQTGDTLGASQQVGEIAALAVLVTD